jgi:adenine deaminase
MPGLIETHAHLNESHGEKLGRIFLSYGITTVRNPATNPYNAMENRESMDAGVRLGARVFTTGYTFDGSRIYYAGSGTMHDEKQVDAELQDYVNAGLTPFEALQTATTVAADALGAAGDLGSIGADKLADLVFVDGNPLADIKNARKVRRVMKNGELYSMDVLLK